MVMMLVHDASFLTWGTHERNTSQNQTKNSRNWEEIRVIGVSDSDYSGLMQKDQGGHSHLMPDSFFEQGQQFFYDYLTVGALKKLISAP